MLVKKAGSWAHIRASGSESLVLKAQPFPGVGRPGILASEAGSHLIPDEKKKNALTGQTYFFFTFLKRCLYILQIVKNYCSSLELDYVYIYR